MWYATHCVGPVSGLIGKPAEYVSCFGSGTIRKEFAESIEANSVHGSDAPETAANEIKFFFRDLDIVP